MKQLCSKRNLARQQAEKCLDIVKIFKIIYKTDIMSTKCKQCNKRIRHWVVVNWHGVASGYFFIPSAIIPLKP